MQISKELIEAFFAHQCTPEEALKVSQYLNANPAEAEKYLSFEEFQASGKATLLPDEFWNRQWNKIQSENNKGRVFTMFKRMAVAAIFIIALGASIFYFTQSSPDTEIKTADISQDFKTDENKTQSPQVVTLSDGSIVELMPGASLTYKNGFEKNTRDLVLKGEAVFSVAKDKTRPFTVYSGNISTTALGTKFKVVHWGNGTKTKVLLYEGKVVVKSQQAKNKKESFLLPGDMLSYNDNLVSITKVKNAVIADKHNPAQENVAANKGSAEENIDATNRKGFKAVLIPNWYKFEKESLANVFDQLADLYNVKIDYSEASLDNKYFIGKFEQKNSIDKILNTIAELNRLKVEKVDESHFVIK